jgi:hypothetical protein
VHFSPVIHEHEFIKLRIIKNMCVEPSTHLSYLISTSYISQKLCLLIGWLLAAVLHNNWHRLCIIFVFRGLLLSVERTLPTLWR